MDVLDRHGLLVTRYVGEEIAAEVALVREMVAALGVRRDDRQPKAKYDRSALPLAWSRVSRLGQDHKDTLLSDAMEPASRVFDSDGFTLRYGEMDDPYTGQRLVFEQAAGKSGFRIGLDHVVSLADAFASGGWRWSPTGRNWPNLYNDRGNIQAVAKAVNQAKGSRSAAKWLPVDAFARRFVTLQVQIKTRYRLSVTESEKAAMLAVIG
jgi:hypothetical protein